MKPNGLLLLRSDQRYAHLETSGHRLVLFTATQTVPVEDISAAALRYTSKTPLNAGEYGLRLDGARTIHVGSRIVIGPTQGPVLKLLSTPELSHRHVLRVSDEHKSVLAAVLQCLCTEQILTTDSQQIIESRTKDDTQERELLHVVENTSGLPADAKRVVNNWLDANRVSIARVHGEARSLVLRTLKDTFERYYISEHRFEQALLGILAHIKKGDSNTLHAVPMRMLDGLGAVLRRHRPILDRHGVVWHPRLWDLVHIEANPEGAQKLSLIAVDSYLREGVSRRKFLKLLAAFPHVARMYERIYLAAVVAHDGKTPDFTSEKVEVERLGVYVDETVGMRLDKGARADEWSTLLRDTQAASPLRIPGKSVFYYGTPFDSLPFYWRDSEFGSALFKPLEYYNLSHRPIARAPYFAAYEQTLAALQGRQEQGGVSILLGHHGCGKTYLAARLVETCRAWSYVFWYKCRSFDSIETVVEHLDLFLMRLGIDAGLSSRLYRPYGEADVADRLVRCLRHLDRSAVIVLDGLEAVNVANQSTGELRSAPFALFVTHIIKALTRPMIEGPKVTEPFVLLTHTVPPTDSTGAVKERIRKSLGLEVNQCLNCPHEEEDTFDPVPLARKLVRDGNALQLYADRICGVTNSVPYRTWLAAYWVNRCVRRLGGYIHASVSKEITKIIGETREAALDLDTFHNTIFSELTEQEQRVLQVVSVWRVPWSRADLDRVMCVQFGYDPGVASRIVSDLLEDRAPFLVPLGPAAEHFDAITGRSGSVDGPFVLHLRDGWGDGERYEMPTVAATFFNSQFDEDGIRKANLGIANVIQGWIGRRSGIASDPFSDEVFRTTLVHEWIMCLCEGGRPSEAAKVFSDRTQKTLRRLDRVQQVASRILQAAGVADPAFSIEQRCEMTATHANALVEAFQFSEAAAACHLAIEAGAPDYWRSRFGLIKGKALRYSHRYSEARQQLRSQIEELKKIANARTSIYRQQANTWVGRAHIAVAQCDMAEGRLDDAEQCLNLAAQFTKEMDLDGRQKVEGLLLRHRGTIALLKGHLSGPSSAEQRYREFEEVAGKLHKDEGIRLSAIAGYKQARVLIERLRQWEPVRLYEMDHSASPSLGFETHRGYLCGSERPPDENQLEHWSSEATTLLDQAWNGLRQRAQGDRKWFPAVELWKAYAELLKRRMCIGCASPIEENLRTIDEIGRRMPRPMDGADPAMSAEIGQVRLSFEWQAMIANAGTAANLADTIEREQVRSDRNPYKAAWIHYERMLYLWRASRAAGSGAVQPALGDKRFFDAAAEAYRRGTSTLYEHGMCNTAVPLHRLAAAYFAETDHCLQEQLEAAAALSLDSEWCADVISMLMDRLVVVAFKSTDAQAEVTGDPFLTVPAKVICRLGGAEGVYDDVAWRKGQPATEQLVKAGRHPQLIRMARMLADECRFWARKPPNLDTLGGESGRAEADRRLLEPIIRANIDAMASWLRRFEYADSITCQGGQPPVGSTATRQLRRRTRDGRSTRRH